ncbi:antibiotic biosynthesis monooxygenase [Streptomyces sp. I05A-00742]|uniref:antibiotic biosynthesis monooxygenase family protein n=1 Tax=Streptomyces sp. I05A-00742 TaxID=2732853 RepID=UPI001488D345|nr:antibiotic biosynthesis monooxygenase family protein [Streptomyces sp. I05A-00742]
MAVFVNRMVLTGAAEEYEQVYREAGGFMEKQPGLLDYELLRSLKDTSVYWNVAEWADAAAFHRANEQAAADETLRARFSGVSDLVQGDPHMCSVVMEGRPERN